VPLRIRVGRSAVTTTAAVLESEDTPLKGIAYLVFGLAIFSLQDVIIKLLSGGYPVHEIVFIRGLVAMIPILTLIWLEGGLRLFALRRPAAQTARGLLGFVSYTTYYLALSALPLAVNITLFYSAPLFVTALSVPFLAERVGLRRWLAVVAGFAGVVVVTKPWGAEIEPAMFLAVASALSYALSITITRKYCRNEAGSTLAFYSMVIFVAASSLVGLAIGDGRFATAGHPSAAFLLRAWVLPDGRDFLLLFACGLIAGAGFYCLAQAYRSAPSSLVAPFEYSSLPWAILWGLVFWSELPGPATWTGVLLVMGAGLYIIHRETVQGRRVVRGRFLRPRV
jgi:drug/metabolite transporter (DMT)-like permease